jgi:hypothetical protein
MKKRQLNPHNEKGMAVIESIVLVFIFIILFWYSIGFFGVTHTAILQSIASRNYGFEIFRHRSNLWYFRSNTSLPLRYHGYESRIHGTNNEISATGQDKQQYATERRVAMFKGEDEEPQGRSTAEHMRVGTEVQPGVRNQSVSLDPVWIRVQYGICLTVNCGD